MATRLDVLILDDRSEDAELIAAELRRSEFDVRWTWAANEDEYRIGLEHPIDLIIADYSMPGFSGVRALQLLQEKELDIPFIVVTGVLPDEVAAEFVGMGADDYVLKDRLARLGAAVDRTLEDRRTRADKKTAETALLVSKIRAGELAEISRVISSTGDISEVFPLFTDLVKKLIAFNDISILVIDHERGMLVRQYQPWTLDSGMETGSEIPFGEFALYESLERGEGRILPEKILLDLAERYPRITGALELGFKSAILAPMRSGDHAIGALILWSYLDESYETLDLVTAEQVAAQIAGAIHNDQLRRIAERESRRHAVLAEIGRIVNSAPGIEDVYDPLAECLGRVIPFDRLVIFLTPQDDPSTWRDAHVFGQDLPGAEAGTRYPWHESVESFLDTHRTPFVVDETVLAAVPAWRENNRVARSIGLQSIMVAPLIGDNQVIGTLNFRSVLPDAYEADELSMAGRVADQIAGAITNAQSRRRVEEAREQLEVSEAKYRDLYDNAPDAYLSVDAITGKIVECNETALSVFGFERDRLIGMPVFDLYHPDSLAKSEGLFTQFRETGVITDAELIMRRQDGTTLDVSLNVSAMRDDEGNIVGSRSTIRDITDSVRLRTSIEQAQRALDSTTDMVSIFDLDARFVYVNDAFVSGTGFSRDEVIGRRSPSGQPDSINDEFIHIWSVLKSGEVWSGTYEAHRKNGDQYYEQATFAPVIDEDGAISSFVGIKRDISERIEIENLVSQSVAKQELISTVEHEMRSPLAVVIHFADVLRKSKKVVPR